MTDQPLPADSGSYLLWLYLARGTVIDVGALGRIVFRRGWYCYCGSAFGPGGLQSRLDHHLRPAEKPHWHVDYLRRQASVRWICYRRGVNHEHLWAALLQHRGEVRMPVPGFGSSDCNCASHLYYLPRRPDRSWLDGVLFSSRDDPPLTCVQIR